MPSPNEILAELKKVKYPGFTRDIVSFGIIKDIEVAYAGVTVSLAMASAKPEVVEKIVAEVKATVAAMPGVPAVKVQIEQPAPAAPRAAAGMAQPRTIAGVKHIVAVASGKGGVGKSTVAVNLALAMHALGWRVGLMDADVYGPSVAMMVGVEKAVNLTPERRIIPLERYGIRYISMALFINDETAVIWRGPMVTKLETEFLFNVEWGELDCLVLDLPPGTGDAQLTITQRVALDGGVIVTTPQEIALLDVKRGVAMFEEVHVPVLGVVENMSYYLCRKCNSRHEIFAHGGGARLAESLNVPFLGELPLVRELREGGDNASPMVAANPAHPISAAFKSIAAKVIEGLDKSEARARFELMSERPKISLITITRDEEALIGECLKSAWFCDEKIIIDSFSTDKTVEIARGLGADVVQHEFTNYVMQKQMALDRATGDWVLLMDADEQATHDLGEEILRAVSSPAAADGYRIRRILYHLGHYYSHAIYPDTPVRLFRRERGHIGGRDPHDKVVVEGRVERLDKPILHFSYRDIADHVATMNRFSSRAAMEQEPNTFTPFKMIANPAWRFFNFYIIRGGFRDGGRGLYAAMTAAFYVFLKYAKLYERRLKSRTGEG